MALQTSGTNPNNKNFLYIYGDYTGTTNEYYQVKVLGNNNSEKWVWRYKSDNPSSITGITSVISTNRFTKTNHGLTDNQIVRMYGFTFTDATNPGTQGVQPGIIYYVIKIDNNTFQLSSTSGGSAVSLFGQAETDLYVQTDWSAWYDKDGDVNNSGDAIVVNTEYTLRQGIKVKFTRDNANKYTEGDKWEFTAHSDYSFSDLANIDIKYIQSIDIDDSRNLLAVDTNGDVSVIENIDSDEPSIIPNVSNIGATGLDNLDFENKNKELYVAKGKNAEAVWLGYNKNQGMQGSSIDLTLKSQPAMNQLVSSIETPDRNAFYKSIALRGGGGSATKDARIIIGLKDDDQSNFYVYNRHLDRQFVQTLESKPYIIKKYIGIYDSDKYTEGFLIVRESNDITQGIAEVDLYDLDTSNSTLVGQTPKRINSFYIQNPVQNGNQYNSGINKIHDILFIPDKAPGHSTYSNSGVPHQLGGDGTLWSIVISASRDCFTDWSDGSYAAYEWLWVTRSTSVGRDWFHNEATTIGGWDNITPITNATQGDVNNPDNVQMMYPHDGQGDFYDGTDYVRKPGWYWVFVNHQDHIVGTTDHGGIYGTWSGGSLVTPIDDTVRRFHFLSVESATFGRTRWGIENVPTLHSLEFCGYDNAGENPVIAFTCEFETPTWAGQGGNLTSLQREMMAQIISSYETEGGSYNSTSHIFGPVFLDGSDGGQAISSANTVINDYLKKQEGRPLRWVTNFIPISTVSGPSMFKMLTHTVDFEDERDTATTLKTNLKLNNNAAISLLVNEQDNTIGHLNLDAVPSVEPLFGMNGRFNILTEGTLRRRAVMTYIRPDNRQYGLYRFGDEVGKPMDLSTTLGSHPHIDLFPNDWNKQTSDYPYNAYTLFNKGLGQTNYTTDWDGVYATTTSNNALADTSQKTQYLPILGSTGYDKTGYRLTETNWWAPSTDWKDGTTTVWHPNTDVADYAYAIKNEAFQSIAFFKMVARTGGTTTNVFSAGNDNYFNITTPVTVSGTDWTGPLGVNTAFYRASLVLDGYQETAFISTTAAGPTGDDNDPDDETTDDSNNELASAKDVGTHLKVTVQIKGGFDIPERVTGVAVYRAISTVDGSTDPQSQYRFIQEISLKSFGWNATTGYWEFDVVDTGDAEATYESINGISENIYNLHINYSCNTQSNGYMFVGNCKHTEIDDATNYVFRSQPSKYSIFDWSKDFIQLPFVPVALQGFQGKVFAFSNSQMAMINPETLYIEDTVEGIGCIGVKSKIVTDAGFIWADYRNIYLSTPQINNIGDTILNVDDYGWLNLTNEEKDDVRFGYDARRKAVLAFFTKGSDHLCWAYSLGKQRWDLWQTDRKVIDTLLTKDGHTILLLDNNKIQKYLHRTSERADWEWHSKKLGMGDTMVDKKVRNIKVEGSDRTNISLQYKVPENSSAWQSGTDISSKFSGSTNSAIKLANADNGKLHWIKVKIAGNNTNKDVRAKAASVIYKPKRPK